MSMSIGQDKYSADKVGKRVVEDNKLWLRSSKLPILRVERGGKTYSFESSLGPSGLKDYVFAEQTAAAPSPESRQRPPNRNPSRKRRTRPGESSKQVGEGTNGFTGHKSYFPAGDRRPLGDGATSEQPNGYTISYLQGRPDH